MCPVTNINVWFLCKSCNLNFAKVDDFIEHKKENHFIEFQTQNTSCIVFEERIDGDLDNESGSLETKPTILKEEFQFANDSRIETNSDPNSVSCFDDQKLLWQTADFTALANEEGCYGDSGPSMDNFVSTTEFLQRQEAEASSFQPQYNPCVLLKRLTSKEIQEASSATDQKLNFNKYLTTHFIRRPSVENTPTIDTQIEAKDDPNVLSCFDDQKQKHPLQIADIAAQPNASFCGDSESQTRAILEPKTELVTYESQIEEAATNLVDSFQPEQTPCIFLKQPTFNEIQSQTASLATNRKLNSEKHLTSHFVCRPFKCTQFNCEKAFEYKTDLWKHMKCHSDLRPFGCPQCKKTFKFRDRLVDHVRLHTGERPWKCPVQNCHKSFAKSIALSRHKREVHRNRS